MRAEANARASAQQQKFIREGTDRLDESDEDDDEDDDDDDGEEDAEGGESGESEDDIDEYAKMRKRRASGMEAGGKEDRQRHGPLVCPSEGDCDYNCYNTIYSPWGPHRP